jgi:hypothetical protein
MAGRASKAWRLLQIRAVMMPALAGWPNSQLTNSGSLMRGR